MYTPSRFRGSDRQARSLVHDFPFATLITPGTEAPCISHVPLLLLDEREGAPVGPIRLMGHLARANAHWRAWASPASESVAIFHGPDGYVTPAWYGQNDVPTWNYAAVHLTGKIHIVDGFPRVREILKSLSDRFESATEPRWSGVLPPDLQIERQIMGGIVAFEMEVTRVEAKFKLGQNRPLQDQINTIDGLRARARPGDAELAALVEFGIKERSV